MPTLTVAGHSVTVGDEFLKLSPEEQNSAVEHIASNLPAEKPSGVVAGLSHGVAEHLRGMSSTLKEFGGVDTGDGSTANKVDAKDYKGAHIIREGGNWYNPADYQPSAIPQVLAEQAPGLAQDLAAAKLVGKANKYAGLAAGAGSMLLRTLGPMAKENAKARTGDENADVTTADKVRAGLTGAVEAPINAVGLGRFVPGFTGKVAGVGLRGTGNALAKYLTTAGTEAATGAASDVVGQLGTSLGQEHGLPYDPNKTAEAAIARGAGGALLASPKLAGDTINATKFREFGGANSEAAAALANRHMEHADGESLVGPLGGTKKAADVVHAAHSDVMKELNAASSGAELSQANENTLSRIKAGGKASEREVSALGEEASPDVVALARQALLSRKLKSMGTLTDDKFVGGLSGQLERLRPISNPVGTGVAMGATALAGHAGGLGMLGTFAPHVIGGIAAGYGASRLLDKVTGARSPVQGFTDKFADGGPVRAPAAPAAVDPYNPSAGPWGPRVPEALTSGPSVAAPALEPAVPVQSLSKTLTTNAKLDEGMARITKKLSDEKRKSMIGDALPALQRLAATRAPVTTDEPAQAPALSPIALSMLQKKLKLGLPPEPAPETPSPTPVPQAPAAPVDAFDALKPLMGRQRSIMRGLAASSKQQIADNVAQRKAAGIAQAEGLAGDSHVINEQGGLEPLSNPAFTKRGSELLSAANVMRRLTAEPPADPVVPEGPASPAISALMQKLQGTGAVPKPAPAPAPQTPDTGPVQVSPEVTAPGFAIPQPPVIAKIMKKANGKVKEEPHPEEFTKDYVPLDAEQLWGKGMNDSSFAKVASSEPHIIMPEQYEASVIRDRQKRRGILADIVGEDTGPDAVHASALLQELHHTRRADKAHAAINHFTAKMSPTMRDAIRKRMDRSFINSMWSK